MARKSNNRSGVRWGKYRRVLARHDGWGRFVWRGVRDDRQRDGAYARFGEVLPVRPQLIRPGKQAREGRTDMLPCAPVHAGALNGEMEQGTGADADSGQNGDGNH
jgi:hypothetical protein